MSHRESKRSAPFASDHSGRTSESEHNFVTETTHNGSEHTDHTARSPRSLCSPYKHVVVSTCRLLEEYLDSKRPMSPVSPLSDSPESTKPPSKPKTSEQHYAHAHKNKEKIQDASIKVVHKKHRMTSSKCNQCTQLFFFFNCLYHLSFTCTAQDGGGLHKRVKTSSVPTTV